MKAASSITFLSFILVLFAAFALFACDDEVGKRDVESAEAADLPLQFRGPGYGGVESCRACHAERVASYERTNHFLTLRRPDAGVFAQRIEKLGAELPMRDPSLTLSFSVIDDEVFQESRRELAGRTISRREKIDFVMGSGRIFEGYLYWQDDHLKQLPGGYSAVGDHWAGCPGFPVDQAVFDRGIKPRCLDCHGTYAESLGDDRYRPESIMIGISCERCHGPGEEHVLHHRAHPEEPEGRFIVKPAELERARRLDLCSQCHSEPGILLAPAFHYLPGTDLRQYVRTNTGQGSDVFVHTANQIQRLKASPCFQGSAELDCLACHRTHAPEGEDLERRSLKVCAGCHEPEHCDLSAELEESLRADCLACHMPSRQVSDTTLNTKSEDFLDFFRMTEHRIGSYPLESEIVRARHDREAGHEEAAQRRLATTARAMRARAEEKRKARRHVEAMALLREAGRLDPAQAPSRSELKELADLEYIRAEALAMLEEAKAKAQEGELEGARLVIEAALSLAPEQPEALTLLAAVAGQAGESVERRRELLERALAQRPDHEDAQIAYLEILIEEGSAAPALELALRLASEHPELARAHVFVGQARAGLGDLDGALAAFDRALDLDADQDATRLDRAALLIELGRLDDARVELESLAGHIGKKLAPGLAQLLVRLNEPELATAIWEGLTSEKDLRDRAHLELGGLALDRGDLEAAAKHLANLEGARVTASLLAQRARLLLARGQTLEAQAALGRARGLADTEGKLSLETLRFLATRRIHDADEVAHLVQGLLASDLRRRPRELVEAADLAFRMGVPAAARLALEAARNRPEFPLFPAAEETARRLERRLDDEENRE